MKDCIAELKLAVESLCQRIARVVNAQYLIVNCACLSCQLDEHPYGIAVTSLLSDGPAFQDLSEWVQDIQLQQLQMSLS